MATDDRAWIHEFIRLYSQVPYDHESAEKAFDLKFRNLPHALYKFTKVSPEHLENLRKGQVWMSPPSEMNDPFDSTFLHSPREALGSLLNGLFTAKLKEAGALTPEQLAQVHASEDPIATAARLGFRNQPDEAASLGEGMTVDRFAKATSLIAEQLLGGILDQFNAAFRSGYMVSCFCERFDSPLLWGHYADNHRGFCVGYPIRGALSPKDVQARLLFPIIYSERRYDATARLAAAFGGDAGTIVTLGMMPTIHKSTDWSYEREWRLVNPAGPNGASPAKMPRPSAVYCGLRLAGKDRADVLSAAANVGVPVYDMLPDRATYTLKPVGPIQDADGTPRALPSDAEAMATLVREQLDQKT